MVSSSYSEAATEVLAILDKTESSAVKKIPKKFIEFLRENSSKTYIPNFDTKKPIKELNLNPKTQALLGLIYIKYWANEEEKIKFKKRIRANELKYQEQLREKYNPDNLFKEDKLSEYETAKLETQLEITAIKTIQKETFIQKILNKLKEIFRRKK